MPRKLLLLISLLSFSFLVSAQPDTRAENSGADAAELEKLAVELLRETASDVGSLRSVENRISFNAELASLMWYHDEKESLAMYESVIADFRRLITQLDFEINSPRTAEDEDLEGALYSRYGASAAERKMRVAMAVRQQIALSLVEHAPELGFSFYYDVLSLISNPETRKRTEETDKYFEATLFKRMGEGKAAKAAEFGKMSLKNGIRNHHVELLYKIYRKDALKGIEFGAEILSRLKSDRTAVKEVEVYSSLLNFGGESLSELKPGKKALFEQNDLRDIAEQFARELLASKEEERSYMADTWSEQIDKFAPGKGAQIRAKYGVEKATHGLTNTAANVTAYDGSNVDGKLKTASDERAEREKAERKLFEEIGQLGSRELSAEERQKVIAQARSVIARTPGKEKKVMALNLLAVKVMTAGDTDLAAEIMSDAERFLNPQPKHYRDFLLRLMVASGYAETNPDRAFPLLQDTISSVNETIAAAIKVAEFMDAASEMVRDGEVQVGAFGGSMVREITGELGMAKSTLKALAKADFERTHALTNGFERIEVRVLAKMLVLRAVLQSDELLDNIETERPNGDAS